MYPPIPRDKSGNPMPVIWDDVAKVWRVVRGTEHGQRVGLLGPDGQPISAGNPLPVKGEVTLSGSFASIKSAPVAGAKTVTTTAAELFAGASRLANRYALLINNESGLPIYVGPAGVTTASGYPIQPGDSLALTLSPTVATAIYAISTGSAAVRVLEVA